MVKIDIKLNIEKKHVYLISGLLVLFAGMFAVNAFGGVEPSVMGHSAGEVDMSPIIISGDEVGIGVASPNQKLDVAGNIRSDNMMASQYCNKNGEDCKSVSQMGGASIDYNSCTVVFPGCNFDTWATCPTGYVAVGISTHPCSVSRLNCCKLS